VAHHCRERLLPLITALTGQRARAKLAGLVRRLVLQPAVDCLDAIEACLIPFRVPSLLVLAGSLVVTWFVYVPVHELLHALGCVLGGGTVSRLEIAPIYGAALVQKLFPFVVVGSDYAGRLSGFDTNGRDVTYLLTDFFPYLVTILAGVPLLRAVAARRFRPAWAAAGFGVAFPLAFVPFLSLTGDYYEIGSILVSRTVTIWEPTFTPQRWRSDDLFKLLGTLSRSRLSAGDVAGIGGSFLLGLILSLGTYWAGVGCARLFLGAAKSKPESL